MKNIQKVLFGVILFLAVILRVVGLDFAPPSLNWDEASIGYNAYSILKTGKDEWGKFLPISFRAYGDYKLPGYVYLDSLFIFAFGLNEWGVRLPSAFAGVGTVIFIYLLIHKLTNSKLIALIGMFIASMTPWLIILSRIGLEANLALFFVTGAFYFLLLSRDKSKLIILSALFFVLSLFTYNSSRVVVLPYLLISGFISREALRKKIKTSLAALIIIILGFLVITPSAILQDSSARFRWTTILDEGAINKINELRGSSAMDENLSRLRYNKVTYVVPEIIKNYISHFDPRFLFISGGSNYQYSVPGQALLHWVLLPLFIIGAISLTKSRQASLLMVLGWLLISPIPAAITRDAPHSLRSLFMIPPFIVLSCYGLQELLKTIKREQIRYLTIGVLLILVSAQSYMFTNIYLSSYRANYSWSWQYGYKESVDYSELNMGRYNKVVFSKKYGEPHEFMLFYTKYDPKALIESSDTIRYNRSDWFWVDKISQYEFINDWEIKDKMKDVDNALLITSPGNFPEGSKLLKTIKFLNGEPAFDIVEI